MLTDRTVPVRFRTRPYAIVRDRTVPYSSVLHRTRPTVPYSTVLYRNRPYCTVVDRIVSFELSIRKF